MGRGDRKTRKGKIFKGSSGNTRQKKKSEFKVPQPVKKKAVKSLRSGTVKPVKKKAVPKKSETTKTAGKKTTEKKPESKKSAVKKSSEKKDTSKKNESVSDK